MSKTILICDDSLLIRSSLKHNLSKLAFISNFLEAKDGREGLEILKTEKPDLLCLDIEMPEVDGLEVLQEIGKMKKDGSLHKDFPVIVLSGSMYENDMNVRKAKMYGATEVLAKPEGKSKTLLANTEELEKIVTKYLQD